MFRKFAQHIASAMGSPWAFCIATLMIIAWACSGPLFGFSDTWQLVVNTSTTIVTFLMVFLIQNTQNRDARAMHLKLDELIRGIKGARNGLVDLEDLDDKELDHLQREFHALRQRSSQHPNAAEAIEQTSGELEAEKNERIEKRRGEQTDWRSAEADSESKSSSI